MRVEGALRVMFGNVGVNSLVSKSGLVSHGVHVELDLDLLFNDEFFSLH